jgi:LCP family protein required for cell wall assembly
MQSDMSNELEDRPYKLYRARPKGVRALLRGEQEDAFTPGREPPDGDRGPGTGRRWFGRRFTWKRGLAYLAIAIVAWLLLSFVLFMVSSYTQQGSLPSNATAELSSGGNMLTSANTVLILGTDERPSTGPGSKEPGSDYSDAGSRSDTIMLWRVGGGVSRRLSIPRDTAVEIPGHGLQKINAAYAFGGPALAIKTISQFTGLAINHVIVVNLAAFPPFINAIGGVDVKTGRVCSEISGGSGDGGFTLNLKPGVHHLNGEQALVYARTRENSCNASDSDLTREAHQQDILNAIKAKLTSPSIFFRLPWASWDAPKVLRSDMGGLTLMSLFAGSELGGNAPIKVLKPTGGEVIAGGGDALTVSSSDLHKAVSQLLNG